VAGEPAPKTGDNLRDYPRDDFESRVLIWSVNQQHLYYSSFVLAVPIFCMVIELLEVLTKGRALGKRYDRSVYAFIEISLTAYPLAAILGGILLLTFLTLCPAFFGYFSSIFVRDACVRTAICGGERNPLHLLLRLGPDARRLHEIDSLKHVRGAERHRDHTDVPGQLLDSVHDVPAGVDGQGR